MNKIESLMPVSTMAPTAQGYVKKSMALLENQATNWFRRMVILTSFLPLIVILF